MSELFILLAGALGCLAPLFVLWAGWTRRFRARLRAQVVSGVASVMAVLLVIASESMGGVVTDIIGRFVGLGAVVLALPSYFVARGLRVDDADPGQSASR